LYEGIVTKNRPVCSPLISSMNVRVFERKNTSLQYWVVLAWQCPDAFSYDIIHSNRDNLVPRKHRAVSNRYIIFSN